MSGRAEKSVRNIVVGAINTIVWIGFPFVFRTIIIYVLGKEYLGLNNLFSSILEVLNVVDIGLGNAIQASIYKPIANKEYDKVSALLKLYRNIYRIIGISIMVISFGLLPFLKYLINGTYPNDVNIYIHFMLYATNSALSYTFFAYSSILITANQRMDLTSGVALVSKLFTSILQLITLLYFKDITLYVLCNVLCTALQNVFNYIVAKKYFPQYSCRGKVDEEEKEKLFKDVVGLIMQRVGNTLSLSLDTIVISSFLGLTEVAIYSNYNFVTRSIGIFMDLFFSAIIASIGNSIVEESLEKNKKDFDELSFLNFWLVGWCTICIACMIQNFEWLWTSGTIMTTNFVAILIAVKFYVTFIRKIVSTYKDALGLWYVDKFRPLIGGIFNLIFNIILVKLIGISGVVISTILSYVIIEIPWENHTLFKCYLKNNVKQYYINYLYILFCTVISGVTTYLICKPFGYKIADMCVRLVICIIVPNLIFYLLNFKRTEFHAVIRLKRIVFKS